MGFLKMSEVVENWLERRLGVCYKLGSADIQDRLYNGQLFYVMLKNYNIINENVPAPDPDANYEGALSYLLKLAVWFKLLCVTHSKEFLEEVASKNRSSCLRLLFELYLKLEDKDNIYVFTKQRETHLLTRSMHKFEVQAGKEPEVIPPPEENHDLHLEKIIINDQCTVSRYKQFKESMQAKGREESMMRRTKIVGNNFEDKKEKMHKTYQDWKITQEGNETDMIDKFMERLENSKTGPFVNFNTSPADYVNYLKQKRQNRKNQEGVKFKMQRKLIRDLWTAIINNKNQELEKHLQQKLLQQSNFEKKLVFRLLRSYEQVLSCFDQQKKLKRVKEQYLMRDPFSKMSFTKQEDMTLNSKMTHKLMTDFRVKKSEANFKRNSKFCEQIVQSLADFALLTSHHVECTGAEVSERIYNDWVQLFIKGVPFFVNTISSSASLEDMEVFMDEKTLIHEKFYDQAVRDRETDEVLDDYHLECYLNYKGLWDLKNFPDFSEIIDNLIITSHDVHRMLRHKYPLPKFPSPIESITNKWPRAILNSINDADFNKVLQALLLKQNIILIQVQDALDFCLRAFESDHREKIKFDLEQASRSLARSMVYSEDELGSSITSSVRLKKLLPQHKAVQVPSKEEVVVFTYSRPGQMGKCAFEMLAKGHNLSEILLCKIVVEYLKSLTDYSGFVLLNFPAKTSQAIFLEFLLSGKPLQLNYDRGAEIEFLTDLPDDTTISIDIELTTDAIFESEATLLMTDSEQMTDSELRTESFPSPAKESVPSPAKESVRSPAKESVPDDTMDSVEDIGEDDSEDEETKELDIKKQRHKSKLLAPKKKLKAPRKFKRSVTTREESKESVAAESYIPPLSDDVLENQLKTVGNILKLRESKVLPKLEDNNKVNFTTSTFFSQYVSSTEYLEMASEKEKEMLEIMKIQSNRPTLDYDEFTPPDLYKYFDVFTLIKPGSDFAAAKRMVRAVLEETMDREKIDSIFLFGNEAQGVQPVSLYKLRRAMKDKASPEKPEIIHDSRGVSESTINIRSKDSKVDSLAEEPYPGNSLWQWMEFPIPGKLQNALASVWEAVESVYLCSIRNTLHLIRHQHTKVLPFVGYIRDMAKEYRNLSDERTHIVTNFQLMFNEVDFEFRKNTDLKIEMHYRVKELYNILQDLANQKKMISFRKEQELEELAFLNKFANLLMNHYVSLIQTELDRFIDDCQILCDYYLAMLMSKPHLARLEKQDLSKASSSDSSRESDISPHDSEFIKRKPPQGRPSKTTSKAGEFTMKQAKNRFNLSAQESYLNTALHTAMTKYKKVHSFIKFLIKDDRYGKELRTKYVSHSRKGTKRTEKTLKSKELSEPDKIVKVLSDIFTDKEQKKPPVEPSGTKSFKDMDIVDKMKWEWEVAVSNEVDRLAFKMRLIEARARADLEEVKDLILKAFQDFNLEAKSQYYREMKAIEDVCSVFKAAIEDEQPIQPLLVLVQDEFYIDKTNLLFPDPDPHPPPPLTDITSEWCFSMKQMENMITKMSHISQSGIFEEAFISMLEEMALKTRGTNECFLPLTWSKFGNKEFRELIKNTFKEPVIIDWCHFVLSILNVPHPTTEELLKCKKLYKMTDVNNLETLTHDEFLHIPLWFDMEFADTIEEDLWYALAKELLFKLFQVTSNECNYSALLLAFCKENDSMEGFMKAMVVMDNNNNIIKDGDCYNQPESDKLAEAKIIEKWIIGQLGDTVNSATEAEVKTLPSFPFEQDEYIYSEQILFRQGKPMRSRTPSSEDLNKKDDEDLMLIPPGPQLPVSEFDWESCIPYEYVLTILGAATNHFAYSPDHHFRFLQLVDNLKELYQTKGKNGYIKAYYLADCEELVKLFDSTGLFKNFNLTSYVEEVCKAAEVQNQPEEEPKK